MRILKVSIPILLIVLIPSSMIPAPTVFPKGVTIYYPDKCFNGYTMFNGEEGVKLMDMNGNVVHSWRRGIAVEQPLLKNGHFLDLRGVFNDQMDTSLVEYDWDGNIVWSFQGIIGSHHDYWKTPNGNYFMIFAEDMPEPYKAKITDPERRKVNMQSDFFIEITPEGEIVWEWHECEYLDVNLYCPCCRLDDWTHTNTVQELPENPLGTKDPRFRAGNVLINPRNHNQIHIIDKETKEIVWSWGRGVIDHPHQPTMLESGNIVLFDNGFHGIKGGISKVLEINPSTEEIVWVYEAPENFFSVCAAGVQKLPNGNYLVCESHFSRIFEVTPEKEIVWEYVDPDNPQFYRAFRIPYDHCAQTAALPKPEEKPVIPDIPYNKYPSKDYKHDIHQKK